MADNYKIQLVVEAVNRAKGAFSNLLDDFKRLSKESGSFKLKMTELDGFLKQGIGLGALYKLTTGITGAIDSAERMQNSLRGLAAIARYSGEDIGASMQAAAKLAADGLMDVRSAAQALQNLLARGFSLEDAIAMIERLKDAAAFNRQASLSMSDAVRSATEGLKNENSILVDNAGVTKNVSVMWKEFAVTIGKTADTLTQAEKRQAEFNGIMRETEGQAGNARLAIEGVTGAKAQLAVETERLNVALGEGLTPAFLALAKAGLWVLENFVKPFLEGIEIVGAKLGMFFSKAMAVKDWVASGFQGGIGELNRQMAILDQAMDEHVAEIARKYSGEIRTPTLGRDTGKRRSDVVTPEKKDPRKEALAWKAAQEAAINYDLYLVSMDEQKGKISKSEAIDRRIELHQKLVAVQEEYAGEIDRLNDPTGWYTQQNAIIKTREELLALARAQEEQTGSFSQGMKKGFTEYVQAARTAFQDGKKLAEDSARAMEQAFSDFFFDAMTGKLKSFWDYMKSFLQSIARAMANIMAQRTAEAIIGGATAAPKAHSGGLVMHSGGYVPRFHAGGLSSDERPAILQTGEYVVSRKGVAALDKINSGDASGGQSVNVAVNIENQTGAPVSAQAGQSSFDGEKWIINVVMKNMNTNPAFRGAMGR